MSGAHHSIRLAGLDDLPQLAAIEDAAAEIFRGTAVAGPYLDDEQPTEKYQQGQRAQMLWVAVAPSGRIAGFALARLIEGEPHLEELDVHPDHGRRGIGAALVRTVIAWAHARGATGLTLSTFRDIPWNAPFYRRLGFRALDTASLPAAFRALRRREAEHGLPIEHRVVMRLGLGSSDPCYLRSQYHDASNLRARIELHRRFGTNPEGWTRWLVQHLPDLDGKRVLDVGCGSAVLWRAEIARLPRSASLTLCDRSPGMVREARAALAGDARVRFVVADVQQLPYRDAAFDCVLANHMLYHVADRPRAVAEIARVLAPDGTLIATTNGRSHLAEIDALLSRHGAAGSALAASVFGAFTLENGGVQLATAFADVALHRYDDGLAVTEVEALLAYIRSMARFDPASVEAIGREVAVEIARDGAFRVTKDAGLFLARR